MSGFSSKNLTFVVLIASLVWFSSIQTCYATRSKHWGHTRGAFGSMYKKKGKHHGEAGQHVDKLEPKHPLLSLEESPTPLREGSMFNVLNYGAKGDGTSDDTKAFQAAWKDACKVEASTMIVPLGYKFLIGPTSFSGSRCRKNVNFQLDGTIVAPINSKAWGSGLDQWLEFTQLVGFTIKGKGTLDGRGSVWWSKSVLDSIDNQEPVRLDNMTKTEDLQLNSLVDGKMPISRPMALRFVEGANVTVTGITIQNSPQFHLTFDNCDGVLVYSCNISSPSDSPNTDGIHLHNSKNVIIHNTDLACGDDCISIQTGCTNVLVHDVNCGPGHGISIGSLGLDGTRACVSNITVRDINMHNTMTGVRIKTWQGGEGLVKGVLFSNIRVSEVESPIMIDQYYCDHSNCKNVTSAVGVTNIVYERIRGTYTVQPVHLACSDNKPCMDLVLSDIELKPKPKNQQMYKPFCWKAFGKLNAPIIPEIDCLQEGRPSSRWDTGDALCSA